MGGRGRCYLNILIERPWRSARYEEVYLHEHATLRETRQRLHAHFVDYNHHRPHQTLRYRTPAEVCYDLEGVMAPTPAAGAKGPMGPTDTINPGNALS